MAWTLGFYGDGISFRVVFSQSFWLRVLPGGAHLIQPRWMPEKDSGRWLDMWCLLLTFPELFQLVISLLVPCSPKTTHANSYDGACPGWAVSVSVIPLTTPRWETSYSRYFLGNGVEVCFFCNFFLLCMVKACLAEQKSLSTWSKSRYFFCLKPASTLVITAI